jgi:hypothetical protein
MTTQTNTRPLSKIIGEMAVIASVHASTPGMTRLDRQASIKSDRAHGAKEGVSKTNVSRMPGAEVPLEAIKVIDRQGRKLLLSMTTQWGLDRRLLPNIFIGDFGGKFEDLRRERDVLVRAFLADAKLYLAQAKTNLGSYSVQPPTLDELKASFSFGFDLSPVPDVDAYSTADKELEKAMKAQFADDVAASFRDAQTDLMQRLAEPLENLIDRMQEYDKREAKKEKGEEVGKEGTFKKTVVTNITDMAKLVRHFNFTNDPKIEEIAAKLDVFTQVDHEVLTKRGDVRKAVAARAAEIRSSLGAWVG